MSRWNKTSRAQTVMPLDNLLREKENKNSVAIGTVMKWGDCKFTSIRSSCYNMGALSSTSPIQNSAESPSTQNELNDNKITVEQVPKPRKFFKSRNAAPPAEIQQQIAMQQQQHHQQQSSYQQQQSYQNHISQHHQESTQNVSGGTEIEPVQKRGGKKKTATVKKEKPPKPPKPEKIPKPKKEKKIKEKEIVQAEAPESEVSEAETPSPQRRGRSCAEPTRTSGRSRAKCVNYNEDAGEDEFYNRIERRILPKHAIPATVTSADNKQPKVEPQIVPMEVPVPQQSPVLHPPIVLRISKGTSRLISTDNEDNVISPACGGNSSGDENKNLTKESALTTTDELIAVLTGEASEEKETLKKPEPKSEKLKIRIKKDYIRSYNDSLKEQQEVKEPPEPVQEPPPTRTTRRRGKQQEPSTLRISPLVSEFDSQSSVLGSVCSQNTATTATSNAESRVARSRGSSVLTSDIDGVSQASVAAAPPSSSENNSSNNAMDTATAEKLLVQKGKRGRKKAADVILNPPEPQQISPPPPPTRKTRNTRNASTKPSQESEAIVDEKVSTTVEIQSSKAPLASGRVTRNTRNNTSNSSNASSEVQEVSISSNSTAPVPRFFTRKRKNQTVEDEKPLAPEASSSDQVDQSSALNLSQKSSSDVSSLSSGVDRHSLMPSTASQSSSSSAAAAAAATTEAQPSVPEYKHKKLVKRSWDQDKHLQQQQSAVPMEVSSAPHETRTMITRSPHKTSINNNHLQKQEVPQAGDNPGVKLLISKKKGSIFKSRAMEKDEDNNKKRLNLYKHKWDEDVEMMDEPIDATKKPENLTISSTNSTAATFDGEPSGLTRFTRNVNVENTAVVQNRALSDEFEEDGMTVTGLKCDRDAKKYYQVVRNVKKAHQIQEIGEFQEMDDDVEYLLDALQPNTQVATRCLSALQLALKCMTPSFRMHIRAHGTVPKFFKALEDAPNDPSLGLCTAMVMFALSQDTLKMDLDRGSLELMLNLLECEGSDKQYPKDIAMNKQHLERKQKVRELCEEIQSQGKSIHLNLDNITAAQLAMESLLSLTSKRAGEWLKEDLRVLGGIEHIIRTVCECCHQITEYVEEWTESLLEKLNKIERCLRILENVTSNNEENQKYMLHYKSQVFVKAIIRFFHLMHTELTIYPTTEKSPKESAGVAIREALIPLLKVIINLTHPFNDRAIGSVFFGDLKEIFEITTNLLLFGPSYVPKRHQFDLSVLTLVLLNNLVQSNEKNRMSIMQLAVPVEEFNTQSKQPAVQSFVEFFYNCEDKARMIKKMTDEILDNPKERDAKQKTADEAVTTLIQNSGSHMEHTILASITSTLIGFLVMDNQNNEVVIRRYLRDGKFTGMVNTLMQYYEFLNLTVSSEASSMAQLKTIKNVIDYLRDCDAE
ncbi:CLUMA_CG001424, isoform A [Clunio marinus]|uniref:CLUMA_CG001424, isoform A n=1 Tax=Clunio marinus TaxID=568069 RepID=A0A1J1HJP0_9DIPT|nr:CLUMA_CG001424, isoform A [Clunio marinus]